MIPWILSLALPLFYLVGFYSALDALMHSRQAQSTTAWILSLSFMPFVAVPLYWTLGRRGYSDYGDALKKFDEATAQMRQSMADGIAQSCEFAVADEEDERTRTEMVAFERFGDSPFTCHNDLQLLVNGDATFESIFRALDEAQEYVLIQFYIIHDDEIGTAMLERLLAAQRRGVAVHLLYDKVGCMKLPADYLQKLDDAGARTAAFSGGRKSFQKFRLNFRNHRKIVVVDGRVAFIGGHNVGDEYLGRDEKIGFWRDTHLRIKGPAALALQMSFLRDWYFATESVPAGINVEPCCQDDGAVVQIASSGPHSDVENCGMLFAHLISSAERRVWIATPYLVPDGSVLGALQLACMRGIDVRIMVPRTSDNLLFKYVPFAFVDDIIRAGGKVYFYEKGFMHQKVLLVDDDYGVVSTANFDNRSFHLNFEVTAIVRDVAFCNDLKKMLDDDLAHATPVSIEEVEGRPFLQRLATNATRLLAPIL